MRGRARSSPRPSLPPPSRTGAMDFIAAMHFGTPPSEPFEPCKRTLPEHEAVGQRNISFDASATSSPPPTPSPSSSPIWKSCVGSGPCYNSVSWRCALCLLRRRRRRCCCCPARALPPSSLLPLPSSRFSVVGSSIAFAANCTLRVPGLPADAADATIGWCGFGLSPSGSMVSGSGQPLRRPRG